jgi:hypothetical protein
MNAVETVAAQQPLKKNCQKLPLRSVMWNIIAGILKIFQDARPCPKCGNSQIEPSETRNQPVRCKYCGAEIPAKKEDS